MGIPAKLCLIEWNIGFLDIPFLDLVNGKPYKITWMKHDYHDRFFADPFIVDVNLKTITLFAEEYTFSDMKGRISKLTIDRNSKKLISKEILLSSKYHLSYPFIFKEYVIPEQSQSGHLIGYNLKHNKQYQIANEGLIDATIFSFNNQLYLFASKVIDDKDDARKKLFRYELNSDFTIDNKSELLIKDDFQNSRPGGNFIKLDNEYYRPAQNSTKKVYGESLTLNKIQKNTRDEYQEIPVITIDSHKESDYNIELHTINIKRDICVVDGCKYAPHPIYKLIHKISG